MDEITKHYFTIGEVSDQLGLSPSLIRFWEQEFPVLHPKKNRKGNRVYTARDIETLKRIRYLLKEQKYTIKGAQERLENEGDKVDVEIKLRETLLKLRAFLGELKKGI